MKRMFLAAAMLAASAVVAHADPFAGYYGNTVTITYPDGKTVAKAYVNEDKSWERKIGDKTFKGTYEVKGEEVCFTQTDPAPAPEMKQPTCAKVEAHKAGDSWSTKDDKGAETKFAMTAGR